MTDTVPGKSLGVRFSDAPPVISTCDDGIAADDVIRARTGAVQPGTVLCTPFHISSIEHPAAVDSTFRHLYTSKGLLAAGSDIKIAVATGGVPLCRLPAVNVPSFPHAAPAPISVRTRMILEDPSRSRQDILMSRRCAAATRLLFAPPPPSLPNAGPPTPDVASALAAAFPTSLSTAPPLYVSQLASGRKALFAVIGGYSAVEPHRDVIILDDTGSECAACALPPEWAGIAGHAAVALPAGALVATVTPSTRRPAATASLPRRPTDRRPTPPTNPAAAASRDASPSDLPTARGDRSRTGAPGAGAPTSTSKSRRPRQPPPADAAALVIGGVLRRAADGLDFLNADVLVVEVVTAAYSADSAAAAVPTVPTASPHTDAALTATAPLTSAPPGDPTTCPPPPSEASTGASCPPPLVPASSDPEPAPHPPLAAGPATAGGPSCASTAAEPSGPHPVLRHGQAGAGGPGDMYRTPPRASRSLSPRLPPSPPRPPPPTASRAHPPAPVRLSARVSRLPLPPAPWAFAPAGPAVLHSTPTVHTFASPADAAGGTEGTSGFVSVPATPTAAGVADRRTWDPADLVGGSIRPRAPLCAAAASTVPTTSPPPAPPAWAGPALPCFGQAVLHPPPRRHHTVTYVGALAPYAAVYIMHGGITGCGDAMAVAGDTWALCFVRAPNSNPVAVPGDVRVDRPSLGTDVGWDIDTLAGHTAGAALTADPTRRGLVCVGWRRVAVAGAAVPARAFHGAAAVRPVGAAVPECDGAPSSVDARDVAVVGTLPPSGTAAAAASGVVGAVASGLGSALALGSSVALGSTGGPSGAQRDSMCGVVLHGGTGDAGALVTNDVVLVLRSAHPPLLPPAIRCVILSHHKATSPSAPASGPYADPTAHCMRECCAAYLAPFLTQSGGPPPLSGGHVSVPVTPTLSTRCTVAPVADDRDAPSAALVWDHGDTATPAAAAAAAWAAANHVPLGTPAAAAAEILPCLCCVCAPPLEAVAVPLISQGVPPRCGHSLHATASGLVYVGGVTVQPSDDDATRAFSSVSTRADAAHLTNAFASAIYVAGRSRLDALISGAAAVAGAPLLPQWAALVAAAAATASAAPPTAEEAARAVRCPSLGIRGPLGPYGAVTLYASLALGRDGSSLPSWPARYLHASAPASSESVFIFGGRDANSDMGDVQRIDIIASAF